MARIHPEDAYYPWHGSRWDSHDSLQDYRWVGEPGISSGGEPWMKGYAKNIKRPELNKHFFYGAILDSD